MSSSPSVTMDESFDPIEPGLLLAGMDTDPTSPLNKSPLKGDSAEPQSRPGSESASQKRRRVTRACDECRRKKIKCDGKQPCTHCTVYSYDCTYDQPSNRRRNPPPQYIEALEQKLLKTQAVLHHFAPNLDLDDDNLDAVLQGRPGSYNAAFSAQRSRLQNVQPNQNRPRPASMPPDDPDLESMVHATGELDIDESGNWDYYGHSSNLFFLRRMRDKVGHLDGPEQTDDGSNAHREPRKGSATRIREPGSPRELMKGTSMESPFDHADVGADELPSRDLALAMCSAALDDACAVLNFVHHPTFYYRFERIYGMPQNQYEDQDQKFLPLLYTVLALGCVFAKDESSELGRKGYKSATGIGYKYFWAARQLLDITDCRDLTSLQAIVFMIMFLQCSAKLVTCYAYIGVALRSAMRMGLHRNFRDSFNPIESECRKRVFWTIRKMDIYVGAILGLPQTLSEDEIDQEMPAEVDDECIRSDGIFPMPNASLSPMVAANANFRLCRILTKIVRTIYPIKGFQNREQNSTGSYSVSYAAIKDIEMDLQRWTEELPPQLVPRDSPPRSPGPQKLVRMQQLLRMAYAHAQLLLYRPFLHYVSSVHQKTSVNQRSYACAAACVSVSRNIIHITSEMRRQGLLQGSYWFSMYSTFFGILSLVFFTLENPQSANQNEILSDAREGKETLSRLAKRSMAADRCTLTLDALFAQLGPTLERRAQEMSGHGHKREASMSDIKPEQTRSHSSHAAEASTSSRGFKGRRANAPTGLRLPGRLERSVTQPPNRPPPASNSLHQQLSESPVISSSSAFSTPHMSQGRKAYGSHQRHPPPSQQYQPQQIPFLPSQYQDVQHPHALSDMASVMFPSQNPFAYPRQPMNTLEENYAFNTRNRGYQQQNQQQPPTGQDMYLPASTSAADTVSADEHIDVQLFGPLPPYMHGHEMGLGPNSWGQGMDGDLDETQAPNSGTEMWNQQARSHGLPGMNVNLDDIFVGEEWEGSEGQR